MTRVRRNVAGVLVDVVVYDSAVETIIAAARDRVPFAATALAVHGVMTGTLDQQQRYRLNHLDLVAPDGQPVRWALNWMYRESLRDRVYGPELTRRLLACAAAEGLPVYFYGSRPDALVRLTVAASADHPALVIAGTAPSAFESVGPDQMRTIARRIEASGARLVFVGLGCPRQEEFVFRLREHLSLPAVAVGAAFDYLAGTLASPPPSWQRAGLEWLWRLTLEPRRLWRRYLVLNPLFVMSILAQRLALARFDPAGRAPSEPCMTPA